MDIKLDQEYKNQITKVEIQIVKNIKKKVNLASEQMIII